MSWPGWQDFDPAAQGRAGKDRPPQGRRHKYGAVAVDVEGTRFASKREARRWQALQLLARAGRIRDLRRQVHIPLHAAGGTLVGRYVADFVFWDVEAGREITEDAKGVRTELYLWKRRHVQAEYGRAIQEV